MMDRVRPYESAKVRAVTGPAIRPGGLDLTGRAAQFLGLRAGDRVLDVGCGAGATVDFLNGQFQARAVGMDLSPSLLGEARQHWPALPLIQGNGMRLPLQTARFQAVYCECVLSLLPEPVAALGEFHRVMQPGGYLVIADLYRRAANPLPKPTMAAACLQGAVEPAEMVRQIETAGFSPCLWEDHSDRLKALAAQLVWAGIAIDQWQGGPCRRQLPGYGLLVAVKGESPAGSEA